MKLWKTIICSLGLTVPILAHGAATYTAPSTTDVSKTQITADTNGATPRVLSDKISDYLNPKDYGAKMVGGGVSDLDADANAIQAMMDNNPSRNKFTITGAWPVGDSTWNTYGESYARWAPDHSKRGSMFIDTLNAFQSDNNSIPIIGVCSKEPHRGDSNSGPAAADIYLGYENGGLYWNRCVEGGRIDNAPSYNFRETLNTDDNPYYFNSGEYNNTIIADIEGYDTGRSGQLVALQVGVNNTQTKGFMAQEQLINFNGSYTGHSGHWDLVGGFTDLTGEPSGGGWEHNLWEADAGGVGPILNHCNETPLNSNCGRQGIIVVPGNAINQIAHAFSYSSQATTYKVAYDENQNIGSSDKFQNYYNPEHSSHITIPWRTFSTRTGGTDNIQGVFRAYPHSMNIKETYAAESTNNATGTTRYFDHYEKCDYGGCFNWTGDDGGYKVGDVLTSQYSSDITLLVTAVDSSGHVTDFTIKIANPPVLNVDYARDQFTGGSGKNFNLNIYSTYVKIYTLGDVAIASAGSGYSVNDQINFPVGSSSYFYGSAIVSSVDSNGAVTGITFTPSHFPVNAIPENLTISTQSKGTGVTLTPVWVSNKYIKNNSPVSYVPQYSWHENGSGFSVGSKVPVVLTDSYNIKYAIADVVTDSIYGSGSTGGSASGHFLSSYVIPTSISFPDHVDMASPDGNDSDVAGVLLENTNIGDVEQEWMAANAMVGSGYKIGDVLTLISDKDGSTVGTVTVNNIPAGTNGQLDGNMVDITSTVDIGHDFTGPVHATGGSGHGAKFWVYAMPDPYRIDRWMANQTIAQGNQYVFHDGRGNGYIYTATTGGVTGSSPPTFPTTSGSTITDGTVVWTTGPTTSYHLYIVESGIPFYTFYTADGSACDSCNAWQWASEDFYEFGTAFGANGGGNTYMGTFAYTDQTLTNAVLDSTGITATSNLVAQLRLAPDIVAIDFSGGTTNAQKNQNYLAWEATNDGDPYASGWHQLDVHTSYGNTSNPLVLLTDHHETKIPSELTIGYSDGGSYNSLFGGNYPVPQKGLVYLSGRTNTNSADWFSANTLSFYQIPASKITTGNNGAYGHASDGQMIFRFDLSGSEIDTALSINGTFTTIVQVPKSSTQTLGTIQAAGYTAVGTQTWCGTCRAPGEATGAGTGRYVYLNSKGVWKTLDGIDASE